MLILVSSLCLNFKKFSLKKYFLQITLILEIPQNFSQILPHITQILHLLKRINFKLIIIHHCPMIKVTYSIKDKNRLVTLEKLKILNGRSKIEDTV